MGIVKRFSIVREKATFDNSDNSGRAVVSRHALASFKNNLNSGGKSRTFVRKK
jgi:hypothetical protein